MRSPFQTSTEKLDQSDPHDEMVKLTDARCAKLREICWKMQEVVRHYHEVRDAYETSVKQGSSADLDEVMEAYRDCSAMERDILNLRDEIERSVSDYNFGREPRKRIYVAHTAEGLPIRVSKTKTTPLWG